MHSLNVYRGKCELSEVLPVQSYKQMVDDMPEPLGDVRKEAIDIYDHIDKKELRESYLAHIPQLGI